MAIGIIATYRENSAVKWVAGIKKEGELSDPSSFTGYYVKLVIISWNTEIFYARLSARISFSLFCAHPG
jgi:hypothetical protein